MDSPQSNKEEVKARLVDTHNKKVYCLKDNSKAVIVSHSHLSSIDGQEDDDTHQPFIFPSKVGRDKYCVEIFVQDDGNTAVIRVLLGSCTVNGEKMTHEDKPRRTTSGTFLNIGSSYQLQYLGPFRTSNDTKQGRRVLPRTPGKEFTNTPPSKPRRQSTQPTLLDTASGSGSVGSLEVVERPTMDDGLRSQLQRIAKEITARDTGYKDRKPPPPYEQVGNSVAFQLLHQNHTEISSRVINSLYPSLKAMELKDPSIVDRYTSYLSSYNSARQERATPTCMLPADIPTLVFLTESLIDLCSFPTLITLIEKNASLFCQLLAIFSATRQNQLVMSEKRFPSRVLSCMHLGVLSSDTKFQRCGWIILANTVNTPTVVGNKPALTEPSLTLALSLIERQLDKHGQDLPLVVSILHFLAQVGTTAKACVNPPVKKKKSDEEVLLAYTTEQATRILGLLQEYNILRHIMKVPQELRSDQSFDADYCALVKALVPTRQKRDLTGQISVPLVGEETTPTPSKPPRKPQRTHRFRRSSSLGARELAKKSKKQRTRQLPSVPNASNTSTGALTSDNDTQISHTRSNTMDVHTQSKDMLNSLTSVDIEMNPFDDNNDVDVGDEDISPLLHSQSCSALDDGTHDEKDDDLLLQTLSEPDMLQETVDSEQIPNQDHEKEQQDQESVDSKQQGMNQDEIPSVSEEAEAQEQELNSSEQTVNQTGVVTSESGQAERQIEEVDGSQLAKSQSDNAAKKDESTDASLDSETSKPIDDTTQATQNNEGSLDNYNPDYETKKISSDLSHQPTDTDEVMEEESITKDPTDVTNIVEATVSTQVAISSETNQNSNKDCNKDGDEDGNKDGDEDGNKDGDEDGNKNGDEDGNKDGDEDGNKDGDEDGNKDGDEDGNKDGDELKVVPNLVLETTNEESDVDLKQTPTSAEWKSPPPTPRTASLARDVQSLLDSLRVPLSADEMEQIVRVPSVSRNNHYYRHSLKRRNIVRQEESEESETSQEVLSPSRMRWGEGTHPPSSMAQVEDCSPFEVSGLFLSTTHATLEDITSGHSDMTITLRGRIELLGNVLELWRKDKGLQAATNTLHGCFSEGSADIPLFTDLMQCFMKHQSSWTIAVCVVLLPALRQLVATQTDERHLSTVCATLQMIVNRFSDLILKCKSPPTSSRTPRAARLSATIDRQQLEVCYRELHATRSVLHNRLDLNFDPKTVSDSLRKVHALLKPYREEPNT